MKTKNRIRKATTLLTLASQLLLCPGGRADQPAQNNPEFNFVYGVEELKGEGLSRTELKTQLHQLASDYARNSQDEGRPERFAQALVDLKVSSPEQARLIADRIQTDPEALAGLSLDGAQFSRACAIGSVAGAATAVGGSYGAIKAGMTGQSEVIGFAIALLLGGMIVTVTCQD